MLHLNTIPGAPLDTQAFASGTASTWLKTDIWSLGALALYLWFGEKQEWLDHEPLHTAAQVADRVAEHCTAAEQKDLEEYPDLAAYISGRPLQACWT
jgi:hypothetical protein